MSTLPPPRNRRRLAAAAALVLLAGLGTGGYVWWKTTRLPLPGSAAYEEYVEAFEVGVAALDVGVGDVAEKNLTRAVELVPREPAGWADRGLFYLRSRQFPQAAADLGRAEQLAPDDPDIQLFLGLLDEQQGKFPEAAARLRRVVEKNPTDVEALYALARLTDRERKADADAEYQQLMERILAARPDNRLALVERLQVAVRRGDKAAVADTLARFRRLSGAWTEPTKAQFADLEKDPAGGAVFGFRNLLMAEPGYTRDADEINPRDVVAGRPLRTFRRLAPARNAPAAPDDALTFAAEPLAAPAGKWDVAVPVWLTADAAPVVFVANDREVRRSDSAAVLPSLPLAPDGLVSLDWNNDFRTDLLLAGPRGLRFYQQGADGTFTDATAATKLPADVLGADITAALPADVDLDGDLDVVVARRTGPCVLLRNNLDGTFTPRPIFAEATDVRAFAWADLDDDGVADAATLDARGRLQVFANERFGSFVPWPAAPPAGKFLALAVTDADADGVLDLVAVRDDGAILRISARDRRGAWDVAELARGPVPAGDVRLFAEDLDNNGVPDLLMSGAAGGAAWLGGDGGTFTPLAAPIPARVSAVGGTGAAELLALDADGKPQRFRAAGTKGYHWQTIRFRAQPQADGGEGGDNRINSFAVGGEIEVRSGTHVVKRPITGPAVRVGLGTRTRAQVVRVRWPNGVAQVEFELAVDQTVSPLQRLKGSCPFLFTWNGERFVFVADFMWSTPLGMYINAQNPGGILQTREWVRVRGDQLVPRDGHYELRAQANLWETHYFDHLALHVVDHPPGTELYVDERFALEPTEPTAILTGPARPVSSAKDHRGADATAVVKAVDGVYLDRCGRGLYQGVTSDHWVEVDLGDEAPADGPVWLVAHGWIHPTDSSINLALEQGTNARPRPVVLEVPDGRGGWRQARVVGFPAGKNKTVLIRLDGLAGPGVCRRFRLRTNMEVFWDALHVAPGRDFGAARKTELRPALAELRHRGILKMTQANPSSPELPHYDSLESRRQVWRDLIGFHTRFGDVTELLASADDRYAILTAGDEILLRFAEAPPPPAGWVRTFVWVNDGWVKDGDLNTRFGGTVLPLPYHGMPAYDRPPGRLADDPVFRRFPKDWETFHTRHVSPDDFSRGLRPGRGRQP
ncbi:CRTAC1 family protein [Urbifossiella limnaea]|uniref:Tetratricopeptide repeat protein n=1 Tax=Urbifossiella limnaea TaxID=2528023 RepID=A0A517XM10_9BACT|nr:CRTAC1 family protein [Urbifossiella limnaea]QDU18547.1 Tetratricopeptide repeat protein [Urbifossiella limnaea]